MRYLAFDIECCDGKHICEFGYVITDENFNPLERNVFIINPKKPFYLMNRPHQEDIELFYSEEIYFSSPQFTEFYDKIKQLLEYPDQIVIGHSVGNDIGFLARACERYKLPYLSFEFLDSQRVYSAFANHKKSISLESAQQVLNLDKTEYLHKSDEDAVLTLKLVQSICNQLDVSLKDLKMLCPEACGKSDKFKAMYFGNSLKEMIDRLKADINSLSNNKKEKCLRKFAKRVDIHLPKVKSVLNGKQICFSKDFERNNIKETLALIQVLANHNCKYSAKVSECNYYVATQSELTATEIDKNSRFYAASIKDDGRNVEIISLEELLGLLEMTASDLANLPWPQVSKKEQERKHNRQRDFKQCRGATLGEIAMKQGVDLSKLFK